MLMGHLQWCAYRPVRASTLEHIAPLCARWKPHESAGGADKRIVQELVNILMSSIDISGVHEIGVGGLSLCKYAQSFVAMFQSEVH